MKRFNSIEDIKRFAEESGSHFFSKDAMRFFRSRLVSETYGDDGEVFITSEQFVAPDGYSEPRRYTVRMIDVESGSVSDVSEWQEFETLAQAKSFTRQMTRQVAR